MSSYRPTVSEVLRITYVTQMDNQAGLNNQYYQVTTVTGLGCTLDQIAVAAGNTVGGLYAPLLTSVAEYRGVIVHAFQAIPQPAPGLAPDPTPGASGDDPLPGQVAGIITFTTEFAGPGGRGRIYVPFPDETDNDVDHRPTATWITAATNLATFLATPFSTTDGGNQTICTPGIWHRPPLAEPSFREITGWIVRSRWGTQRRRGDYGRTNLPPV